MPKVFINSILLGGKLAWGWFDDVYCLQVDLNQLPIRVGKFWSMDVA